MIPDQTDDIEITDDTTVGQLLLKVLNRLEIVLASQQDIVSEQALLRARISLMEQAMLSVGLGHKIVVVD